jgi:hypothetical protein
MEEYVMRLLSRIGGLCLVALLGLCACGCPARDGGKPAKDQAGPKNNPDSGSRHAGWWCDEHGIPEHECSMCSTKVATACKAKGDWCEQHNRAKSQCFKCDPSLKEVFAAKYRAKYNGKEPPPIEDD